MFDTPFDTRADERDRAFAEADDNLEPYEGDHDQQAPLPATEAPPPRRRRLWVMLAIVVVIAAAWWLLRGDAVPAAAPPMAEVTVATPLQREITEWDEFIGRFEASKSVEVRPQVSGQVTAVHFTDGQFVRQGAPLFTIDARSYRASLAEAQAGVASASSALALSRSNLARAQRLIAEDAIAATEIDRLQAEVRANQAALAAAQAQVRSRDLEVEFTTVRAPISGRISDRRVDAGNLVAAGAGEAATLLTTINAVDPIYFEFEGSEAMFLRARREGLDAGAEVDIRLADESDYRWHGTLDFTDNALDQRSGTIRARAIVRNGEGFLAPGLFGNMRLATGGTHQALLVPDAAVATDQTRKLLMVVDAQGTVAAREVQLGPIVDGLRVIESGLAPTDRVVISGMQMAMPGQPVRTRPGRIAPPPGAGADRQPPAAGSPAAAR
ncbi:efflux RND transporter periplasmic adaptor subunit [Erythrobacter arachoides]|uniref:Efflux RND transporter periplasmic adaptor subunit n=1 Tax=Aurantiacibacter arachoides TaxID=1850444 RepID=A0A845A287_9SPHN|nr:efflux RND transporter periplasmic adaptor subunit [Aurantiacibacter arachoides]MXO94048.1 efflux RND transporter periplasmic adaptor subunit [Aurantiacibacter arachoides]GGD44497.1 MexE family multidrug efflux RND transporter periplasmic adaptor subunit [Aurantiacibacter arachoides]